MAVKPHAPTTIPCVLIRRDHQPIITSPNYHNETIPKTWIVMYVMIVQSTGLDSQTKRVDDRRTCEIGCRHTQSGERRNSPQFSDPNHHIRQTWGAKLEEASPLCRASLPDRSTKDIRDQAIMLGTVWQPVNSISNGSTGGLILGQGSSPRGRRDTILVTKMMSFAGVTDQSGFGARRHDRWNERREGSKAVSSAGSGASRSLEK
jgi:hypothetical protein